MPPAVSRGAVPEFCFTTIALPATLSVPVRVAPAGFGSMAYCTEPWALPVICPVMRIHAESLLAVQVQPLAVVTWMVPLAPAGGTSRFSGVTLNEQVEPA